MQPALERREVLCDTIVAFIGIDKGIGLLRYGHRYLITDWSPTLDKLARRMPGVIPREKGSRT